MVCFPIRSLTPVYSSQLDWDPKGDQAETMSQAPPRAVNSDIVIAKMAPGQVCIQRLILTQAMEMELHCEKGIGKDHAKFSPVATASYRLLPHIDILKPIPDEHIDKFINCFSKGVMERGGEMGVRVVSPRKDTVSREVLRHPEFEGHVRLGRVQDHFLCTLSVFIANQQSVSNLLACMSQKICFPQRSRCCGKRLPLLSSRWSRCQPSQ